MGVDGWVIGVSSSEVNFNGHEAFVSSTQVLVGRLKLVDYCPYMCLYCYELGVNSFRLNVIICEVRLYISEEGVKTMW